MRALVRDVAVELSRLRHRRAVALLVAIGLAGALTVLGFSVANAVPPSAADQQAAQAQVDEQMNDPGFQQALKQCQDEVAQARQHDGEVGDAESGSADADNSDAGGAGDAGSSSPGASSGTGSSSAPVSSAVAEPIPGSHSVPLPPDGMTCEEMMAPKVEWYLNWSPPQFVQSYQSELLAVTMIVAIMLALAGITFVGADFASGTIGTQLLYRPRRAAMFGTKAAALAVVAFVTGAVVAALTWLQTYVVAAQWGSTEMVQRVEEVRATDGGFSRASTAVPVDAGDIVAWGLRAAVLVTIAALGGYLLAMLFRSSLMALGLLAAYGIAGEGIIGGLAPSLRPYLLSVRIRAWLDGPINLMQYPRNCGGRGNPCEPTVTVISVTEGGVYLAILLAVGLAIALWSFARRDVE